MTATKQQAEIRYLIRSDLDEVEEIASSAFRDRWFKSDFTSELAIRNQIGRVALIDGRVAGFVVYALHKNRIEILNLCVSGDVRRQGVGSTLVDNLKGALTKLRRSRLTIRVRERNLVAQSFFRSCGFKASHIERSFFEDGEDAYVMRFSLLPPNCNNLQKL